MHYAVRNEVKAIRYMIASNGPIMHDLNAISDDMTILRTHSVPVVFISLLNVRTDSIYLHSRSTDLLSPSSESRAGDSRLQCQLVH